MKRSSVLLLTRGLHCPSYWPLSRDRCRWPVLSCRAFFRGRGGADPRVAFGFFCRSFRYVFGGISNGRRRFSHPVFCRRRWKVDPTAVAVSSERARDWVIRRERLRDTVRDLPRNNLSIPPASTTTATAAEPSQLGSRTMSMRRATTTPLVVRDVVSDRPTIFNVSQPLLSRPLFPDDRRRRTISLKRPAGHIFPMYNDVAGCAYATISNFNRQRSFPVQYIASCARYFLFRTARGSRVDWKQNVTINFVKLNEVCCCWKPRKNNNSGQVARKRAIGKVYMFTAVLLTCRLSNTIYSEWLRVLNNNSR